MPASWLVEARAATPRPGFGVVRPLSCCPQPRALGAVRRFGWSRRVGQADPNEPCSRCRHQPRGICRRVRLDAEASGRHCDQITCAASRDTCVSSSHHDQPRAGRAWLPAEADAQPPQRRTAEKSATWWCSKAPPWCLSSRSWPSIGHSRLVPSPGRLLDCPKASHLLVATQPRKARLSLTAPKSVSPSEDGDREHCR